MNYYKRHLGDYARDTGHLTALEHGIYTLLLDWYYINERPIPHDKAIRIARGNPAETDMVLREFFTLGDDGWQHARADRELAEYRARSEKNREVGKLGGRPKNPTETQTVSESKPNETLATSHKPTEDQKPSSSGDDRPAKLQERVAQITDDAITAWNASALVAGGLPAVRAAVGREKRQAQVRRMLRTARAMCLDLFGSQTVTPQFWVGLWAEYAKDDFFSGRLAGGKGHENWKPDFEFLTREDSVLKLYDRRATA